MMGGTQKRHKVKQFDPAPVFAAADGIWKNGEGDVPELKDVQQLVKGTTQSICDAFQDWLARRLGRPLPTPVPSVLAKALDAYITSENEKSEAHWEAIVKAARSDVQHLNEALTESAEEVEMIGAERDSAVAQCEQLKGQMQHKDEIIANLQREVSEARDRAIGAKVGQAEWDKERDYLLKHSSSLEQTIDELKRELERVRGEGVAAKIDLASARAALDAQLAALSREGGDSAWRRGSDESQGG